jgi:hypothetical protein
MLRRYKNRRHRWIKVLCKLSRRPLGRRILHDDTLRNLPA